MPENNRSEKVARSSFSLVKGVRRRSGLLYLGALAIWLLPFMWLGSDSVYVIHDQLDDTVATRAVLAASGEYWAFDGTVDQVMNGLSRRCFPPSLNATNVLYTFLPPFGAFHVNYIWVHVVAFLAMLRLANSLCPDNGGLINGGIAFAFATLPFYTAYGLSVAGLPILIQSCRNMLAGRHRADDLFAFIAFPFASSLVYTGVFVLASLFAVVTMAAVIRRHVNGRLVLAIALMVVGYAIAESRLIASRLDKSYVSHRSEFDASMPFDEACRSSVEHFVFGHYHSPSLHTLILLLAVPLALGVAARRSDRGAVAVIGGVAVLCLAISLLAGFQNYSGLSWLRDRISLLREFQFGRFHWFQPVIWHILLVLCARSLCGWRMGGRRIGAGVAMALVLVQMAYVSANNYDFRGTAARALGMPRRSMSHRMSFAEFYSKPLFEEVAGRIGLRKSDYRVISVGIHPAVSLMNGFYSLDYYGNDYPLSYKRSFRGIISKELDKSEALSRRFDRWGSRCYAFSHELGAYGAVITRDMNKRLLDFEIDSGCLSRLGGRYVLSAVEIVNAEASRLSLVDVFEDEHSPWRIFLYRNDSPSSAAAGDQTSAEP